MATIEATLPTLSNGHNGHVDEIEAVELTGAQIVCKALEAEGVDIVFGYPGGAVIPLYDALPKAGFHHVLTRFEQWAALAADGYARATGRVGVCMATSGPGATNLVTGLANAQLDSVPVVAITGQVVQPLIGKDAFQECDITGITLPVTKHNYLVTRIQDIAPTIKEAFYLAKTGRPGPVLVDIPKSLFVAKTHYKPAKLKDRRGYQPTTSPNMRQVKLAADAINRAEKPLFMAGHGIMLSGAEDGFAKLVEKTGIPVAFTLLGQGCYPESKPLALGLMGMHGHRDVNKALEEADLLVNIGARFDDRATGKISGFAPKADVVHVDIDPAEIGKNVETKVPVVGDAREVIDLLIDLVDEKQHDEWIGLDRIAAQLRAGSGTRRPTGNARALYHHQGDRRSLERRSDLFHRCRATSDVGRAASRSGLPEPLVELGRSGHDGIRVARGDRRQVGMPG